MEISSAERVLVLAPHTDDGELGAGATINKLKELGCEVKYVAFSIAEDSVSPEFPKDILATEVLMATSQLGLSTEDVIVYRYPVRNLDKYRQEILEKLISIRKQYDPTVIFVPSTDDIHQDHEVISKEGVRAFKNRIVLGYELPWNNFRFHSNFFFEVSKRNVENKILALGEYKTQKGRNYVGREFTFGQAKYRGVQAGLNFAEAFEVIRCVIK